MSFGFCTFVRWIDKSKVVLRLQHSEGYMERIFSFPHTKDLCDIDYTEEEFKNIKFDSLTDAPCIFIAYTLSEYLSILRLLNDEQATAEIKKHDGSYWLKADPAFIKTCKVLDPSIETKLFEERNKRLEEAFPEMKKKETVVTCTCPKCGYVWKETHDAKVHKSSDN